MLDDFIFCKLEFLEKQDPALSKEHVYRQSSTRSVDPHPTFGVASNVVFEEKIESLKSVIPGSDTPGEVWYA